MLGSVFICSGLFDVAGALIAVLVGVAIGMLIGSLMLFAIVLIKNRWAMSGR